MFIFRVYLSHFSQRELIIEIRNSEIQRMMLSFFKFIQDNSQVIDANAFKNAIAELEDKNESRATSRNAYRRIEIS